MPARPSGGGFFYFGPNAIIHADLGSIYTFASAHALKSAHLLFLCCDLSRFTPLPLPCLPPLKYTRTRGCVARHPFFGASTTTITTTNAAVAGAASLLRFRFFVYTIGFRLARHFMCCSTTVCVCVYARLTLTTKIISHVLRSVVPTRFSYTFEHSVAPNSFFCCLPPPSLSRSLEA